jgi:biotin transport system substrate-specific component
MIPGAMLTGWLAGQPPPLSVMISKSETVWQIARGWLACVVGGVLLVYAIGIPWLAWIAKMDWSKASLIMLAYVPVDLCKALLAALISQRARLYV